MLNAMFRDIVARDSKIKLVDYASKLNKPGHVVDTSVRPDGIHMNPTCGAKVARQQLAAADAGDQNYSRAQDLRNRHIATVRAMASRRGPGEVALGLVLLGVLVGLALVAQDHWKQGLSLMG